MKLTKKCVSTSTKISISKISRLFKLGKLSDRRRPSAGCSTLLRAGAVTSLILLSMLLTSGINGSAFAATSTITLSIVDGISVNVLPSGNGTFASSSGTNNISIKTTHATGYTLGIKAGTSGSNALINTNDSSKTIPSITSSISESTYSSSSTYNNTWGFKPSKLNSASNSNYIAAPTSTSTPTILDKTTTANPSTNNNYTITLGTRINNSQAPGTYANTFIITAIVNPTPYTITYNKNTTDTVTNMPSNVSTETYDETVTISNQVPAREGFNFKGWCTTQTADGGTCSGTTYNPDGGGTALTWTLDQTVSSNSLNLYAMWASSATPTVLYDAVAGMTKGTMASNNIGINDTIVAPTAEAPISSNSGVFTYNGSHSDAASTSTIYFYRGILDTYGNTGTYGSNGLSDAYPNYVVLSTASNKGSLTTSNTCWRIVRTTGSGGVKMIYNGKWTGSTCANSKSNANAVSSVYFNRGDTSASSCSSSDDSCGTTGFITYVGYNYNNTYAYNNTSYTSNVNNSTLFNNGTASNLRTQLESWYSGSSSGMSAYTSKLETSAGWCNDRTTYTSNSATASPTTQTIPYKTSSASVYFGANHRLVTTNAAPTLQCPNTTGNDLLSTSKGMSYAAAPLTADEAALAGSGYSGKEAYHANSYLRSGNIFWLLSPSSRVTSGYVYEFYLYSDGRLSSSFVSDARGVRPSISLKPGTSSVSGTGTATNPWIVNP